MLSIIDWLKIKFQRFASNTYLVDAKRQITYAETEKVVKQLLFKFDYKDKPKIIVFLGDSSIEAYQLYFAVIGMGAIWIPLVYGLETNIILDELKIINPDIIIYDKDSILNINFLIDYKCVELMECFTHLNNEIDWNSLPNTQEDRVISCYLTSGSTGLPKIVQHSWHATLQHAHATVLRYQFNSQSRLFNARQLFYASGAFALPTLMHCGGSIVIPETSSYKKSMEDCALDWAQLMIKTNVTHASFFPTEMKIYADSVEKNSTLNPRSLKRITTGGEGIEFNDLIKVCRAFANNRFWYDYLWMLYPYMGEGKSFRLLIAVYEYFYGHLVQITQTYGATELICNAVANTPISGPDTRGIGSTIDTLRAFIIDEQGMPLPQDGTQIGRLRFYGCSIATGYLNKKDNSPMPYCYETNDLASISSNGCITLFGRRENLIKLPGMDKPINPVLMEKEIRNLHGVQNVIVCTYNSKLHAAIKSADTNQNPIIRLFKSNKNLKMIESISFWQTFPLDVGGKIDKKNLIDFVNSGKINLIFLEDLKTNENRLTMNGRCNIV